VATKPLKQVKSSILGHKLPHLKILLENQDSNVEVISENLKILA
jgi:hypothetical protein